MSTNNGETLPKIFNSGDFKDLARKAVLPPPNTFAERIRQMLQPKAEVAYRAEQFTTLHLALSARYPIAAEWINSHRSDIDPQAPNDNFFKESKSLFVGRDVAIGELIKSSNDLSMLSPKEKLDKIRDVTSDAEIAISQSWLAAELIKRSKSDSLTPMELRVIIAKAASFSSAEMAKFGGPTYSTITHTEKVIDFINKAKVKGLPNEQSELEDKSLFGNFIRMQGQIDRAMKGLEKEKDRTGIKEEQKQALEKKIKKYQRDFE